MRRCLGARCLGAVGLRTLAYVVTDCRENADATGFVGHQALRVQRGEHDPVTVMDFQTTGTVVDLNKFVTGIPACQRFGEVGVGDVSLLAGYFQRLGVTPDGSGVVFEVTDDFQLVIHAEQRLAPGQRGIFFVNSDGSGLRRIADATRVPPYQVDLRPPCCRSTTSPQLPFSHDGRTVLLTDLGPGPANEEAVQVFTLDVITGARTQVTHLPVASSRDPLLSSTGYPDFIPGGRILFYSYANPYGLNPTGDFTAFTVRRDGSALRTVFPSLTRGPSIRPIFQISGRHQALAVLEPPGEPVGPPSRSPGTKISEVLLLEGKNLVQLTAFKRTDTSPAFVSADGQRAFFIGSADPFGTNPTNNCQLFSIRTFGAGLRQLTRFRRGTNSMVGCFFAAFPGCSFTAFPYGCSISTVVQDPITQVVLFYSSCDPFGTNPRGGQLFGMRPDGSRLRQITDVVGCVPEPGGGVSVSAVGPFAYSGSSPTVAME